MPSALPVLARLASRSQNHLEDCDEVDDEARKVQLVSGAFALPLLSTVREIYPEISLELTEELSGTLIEQLRSGRINLALLFDDGQLGGFTTTPLVEEDMMFITRTESRFRVKGKTISLAKAVAMPLILPGLYPY